MTSRHAAKQWTHQSKQTHSRTMGTPVPGVQPPLPPYTAKWKCKHTIIHPRTLVRGLRFHASPHRAPRTDPRAFQFELRSDSSLTRNVKSTSSLLSQLRKSGLGPKGLTRGALPHFSVHYSTILYVWQRTGIMERKHSVGWPHTGQTSTQSKHHASPPFSAHSAPRAE